MKTVTCTNCGASASNLQNCEHCGSIFVRSNEFGYESGNIQGMFYFQAVADALKANLEYQLQTDKLDYLSESPTTTDIFLVRDDFFGG
jgi:hypothetical protein